MKQWATLSKTMTRGFTIVELLIVVVVIAILAAITIVAFNGVQNRARESAARSEVSQVQKAIQVEATLNGTSVSVATPTAYLQQIGEKTLLVPLVNAQEVAVYGVFDTINTPSGTNWASYVRMFPSDAANALALRSGASTESTARGFYATSAQQNRDLTQNNILDTTRRNIGWITANSANIVSGYNGASSSASLAPHTGWNFDRVVNFAQTGMQPVATLVFNEYHDPATRAQVISWLNKQYSIGL